jgi:CRP-like cAMP-binding protein
MVRSRSECLRLHVEIAGVFGRVAARAVDERRRARMSGMQGLTHRAENRLLAMLSSEEFEQLRPSLRPEHLRRGQTILLPGDRVLHAYFPTQGVLSMSIVLEDGGPVEVVTVGREGFVCIESVLTSDRSPYEVFCQTDVEAFMMDVETLRGALRTSDRLRRLLLHYVAFVYSCTGRALACKVSHLAEERLARWLLMTRDQMDEDKLPLTQDVLARMLGVHRPTVSAAAEALQRRGLIAYHRGQIAITDRAGLEAASCEDYRAVRAEYERLLGSPSV